MKIMSWRGVNSDQIYKYVCGMRGVVKQQQPTYIYINTYEWLITDDGLIYMGSDLPIFYLFIYKKGKDLSFSNACRLLSFAKTNLISDNFFFFKLP